jgi:sugar lactone lactonase YvrE
VEIDIVVDVKATLGEGPVWDVEQQRLYWIDSFDGRVFRSTADGRELRAWDVGAKIGSMALRQDGKHALVALQHGIHSLDFVTGNLEMIVDPESGLPNNRLNDGKVDAAGRFIFGSMDTLEEQASGRLYSLDPNLTLKVLDQNIIVSNGPCWSRNHSILYFADTWSGEIWAYDYDVVTGAASNRRCFAQVDQSGGGAADGATVDEEDHVWQALVYSGKIVRYAPDGHIDRVIEMPVRKVTSVMFGGPELDILFVTSMAKPPLPRFPDDGQARGALFAVRGLGVRGLPERRFGS